MAQYWSLCLFFFKNYSANSLKTLRENSNDLIDSNVGTVTLGTTMCDRLDVKRRMCKRHRIGNHARKNKVQEAKCTRSVKEVNEESKYNTILNFLLTVRSYYIVLYRKKDWASIWNGLSFSIIIRRISQLSEVWKIWQFSIQLGPDTCKEMLFRSVLS